MKLYNNKNIVALMTALSLISIPVVSKAIDTNLDAYYDDTSINIEKRKSFTLRISKQRLEELINSKEENYITIKIDNEEVTINKKELIYLKNKADSYDTENREYTIIIALVGAIAIETIIIKEKVKNFI